jgi:hypothetical protein
MSDTLPTSLDPIAVERYRHTLACSTYAKLLDLAVDLACRAVAGDRICGQLLPIVVAEADARPEGKTAELRRQNWRLESWLHPEKPRRVRTWRLLELLPGDDLATGEPCCDQPIPACHPAVAFSYFTGHVAKAAAAHHRLVLTEA